jgi:uncharacterized Zn-binding protein involved in type VI secretion
MGQPAAKQGDRITAKDSHNAQAPNGAVSVVVDPFDGPLSTGLSSDVKIMGKPAAVVGSGGSNTPSHIAKAPLKWVVEPTNQGKVTQGSSTVKLNGKPAARDGDQALTCDDITPGVAKGRVEVAPGATVSIG